jgi:hypothetical protein
MYQKELDRVMTLMMFDDYSQSPLRDLIRHERRKELASEVNQVILKSHGYQADSRLNFYWQMLQWAQDELKKTKLPNGKKLIFPTMLDPLSDGFAKSI